MIPFEPLWTQYKRLIKPRGAVVLFGSQPFTSALVMSNPGWFRQELIWEKSKPVGYLDANVKHLRSHENILLFSPDSKTIYNPQKWQASAIFIDRRKTFTIIPDIGQVYGEKKPKAKRPDDGSRYPVSIISVDSEWGIGMHPTQKPVALLEYLIKTYTNPGDTVLDSCMGSGSTGCACINTGRDFIGIELDTHYFTVASERIRKAQAAPQQLEMVL